MGMFSTLMNKIFRRDATAEHPYDAAPATPGRTSPGFGGRPAAAVATPVDVTAMLDKLAAENSEKLDWRHSIVDLMKLVGIDSGLTNRKELAAELKYPGDTNDSAKMNMWLHKEVMKRIAENGGNVPANLKD